MSLLIDGLPQVHALLSPYAWILLVLAGILGAIAIVVGIVIILARLLQRTAYRLQGVADEAKEHAKNTTIGSAVTSVVEQLQEPQTAPEQHEDAEKEEDPAEIGRRTFLSKVSVALAGLGGAIVAIPFIRVVFLSPIEREEPDLWRPVGSIDDFQIGDTVQVSFLDAEQLQWAGFAAQTAAWLRRTGEQEFVVFSSYCTHVGCPVRWEEGASMFMCPCHGGAFHSDGAVAAGPPPSPLVRYEARVLNGQVEIRTGVVPRT